MAARRFPDHRRTPAPHEGAQRGSISMRREGSRQIFLSCQNYYAERDLAPSKVRGPHQYPNELDRCDSQNGENKKVAIFETIIVDKTIQPVLEEKVGTE